MKDLKNIKEQKKNDDYMTEKKVKKLKKNKKDEKEEEEDDSTETINEFGREQQMAVCQYCQSRIFTNIEQQTSWFGILLSLILFFTFKLYSLLLILLVIPLTQSTIHTCPNCLNRIGIRTFYDTLSLSDKVFTFQLFSIGVIITKKQLLGIFFFVLFGIFLYVFTSSIFSSINFTRQPLKDTWNDYYNNCVINDNENFCKEKYLYRDINWEGYVMKIDMTESFFTKYKVFIYIKMDENSKSKEADLVLQFLDIEYEKYKTDILNTTRGDLIAFNGTFVRISGIYPSLLNGINYKKLNKKINIAPAVFRNGRYYTDDINVEKDKTLYKELPSLVSNDEQNKKE